jgi:hypothetical protein
MRNSIGFQQTLALSIVIMLLAVACNSGSNSSSNVNLAGTWTGQIVSSQGNGTFSGTATVAQSGAGLGNNGATTLTAPVGTITISETGTTLTGTITDSNQGTANDTHSFSGTLSGGNITITGSSPCSQGTRSISITGTITSTSMQGNYTVTQSGGDGYCKSDAGTWTATKQ